MQAGGLFDSVALLAAEGEPRKTGTGEPPLLQLLHRRGSWQQRSWPLRLRWVGVGAAGAVCLLVRAADSRLLPTEVLASVAVFVLFYSTLLAGKKLARSHPARIALGRRFATIALDLVALAVLLAFSGGVYSPLVPFLLLPIIVTPFAARPSDAYISAAVASLLLATAATLADPNVSPRWAAWVVGPVPWADQRLLAALVGWGGVFLLAAAAASWLGRRLATGESELWESFRQLEQQTRELQEANLRLEELIRTRTSPLQAVAHQLKANLSSLQGLLDTILNGYACDHDSFGREMVERARDSAAGMLELVNDLLYLGYLREDGPKAARRWLDLAQLALEIAREQEDAARAHGLRLVVDSPDEPVGVWANGESLQRMLLNLLENAIRYTPRGGTISITARREGGKALISVSDTGIGIDASDLPRIFDDFFRGDNARRMHRIGVGLGLSIAKQVVDLHDGELRVSSELGRGSCFTASFEAAVRERIVR